MWLYASSQVVSQTTTTTTTRFEQCALPFLRSLSVESLWVPRGVLAELTEDAMPVGGHAGIARRRRER